MKKRISRRAILLFAVTVLLATAVVGTTLAFLVDKTPPVTNTFQPVSVSCRVLEDFDTAANVKNNVSVQNTGEIPAYIRATVVVTWVSIESGNTYGGAPVAGVDYTVVAGPEGWVQDTNGFYYCTSPVAPGASTPILLSAISPIAGQAPEGYRLSVQIVASAIQADPAEAVTAVWSGVTVQENGTITVQ